MSSPFDQTLRSASNELDRIKKDLNRKYDSPIIKGLSSNEFQTSTKKDHKYFSSESDNIPQSSPSRTSPLLSSKLYDTIKLEGRNSEETSSPYEEDVSFAFSPSKLVGSPSSQEGVVSAFRFLQEQCRKLESEKNAIFRDQDAIRREMDDYHRSCDSKDQMERLRYDQGLHRIKENHNRLPLEIRNLAEQIGRKTSEWSELEVQISHRKQQYATLQDEVNHQSNTCNQLETQCKELEYEIEQSSIRQQDIQHRLDVIPTSDEVTSSTINKDIFQTEDDLVEESQQSIRVECKLELLVKYLDIMLRVNKDLCVAMQSRATGALSPRDKSSRNPLFALGRPDYDENEDEDEMEDEDIEEHRQKHRSDSRGRSQERSEQGTRRSSRSGSGSRSGSRSRSVSRGRIRQQQQQQAADGDKESNWGTTKPWDWERQDEWQWESRPRSSASSLRDLRQSAETETEAALALLRSRSAGSPRRVFLPTSRPHAEDFHIAAHASKASRAAQHLDANISSRRRSADGQVLGTSALVDDIDRVNEQFRRFNRLFTKSPERGNR